MLLHWLFTKNSHKNTRTHSHTCVCISESASLAHIHVHAWSSHNSHTHSTERSFRAKLWIFFLYCYFCVYNCWELFTYLPTKFSSTELLPADCPPTTAICGKSNCMCTPRDVNASCSLLTIGIKLSMVNESLLWLTASFNHYDDLLLILVLFLFGWCCCNS